jgi:hypothetical protein
MNQLRASQLRKQRSELSPRRVCEPWVHGYLDFGAAERRLNSGLGWAFLFDSINRCSAALDKCLCVTQRSQSLAFGLALAAAPQLVSYDLKVPALRRWIDFAFRLQPGVNGTRHAERRKLVLRQSRRVKLIWSQSGGY